MFESLVCLKILCVPSDTQDSFIKTQQKKDFTRLVKIAETLVIIQMVPETGVEPVRDLSPAGF